MTFRPARVLVLALAVTAVALAGGCGEDDPPDAAPSDCEPIVDGERTLVGELLKWDADCLQVDAGTEITFTVDNRDVKVDHNLAVFGPSGRAKTELEPGPVVQTLVYDADTPGYHQFVCDIHPSMEGQLWVEDPAGG